LAGVVAIEAGYHATSYAQVNVPSYAGHGYNGGYAGYGGYGASGHGAQGYYGGHDSHDQYVST